MAEDKYTKILEIQLNYEKAVKGIAEYELEIKKAREQQRLWKEQMKALEKEYKDGSISLDEYKKSQRELTEKIIQSKTAIKELQYEQGVIQKQLQQQVKIDNAEENSLVSLRAELSNLTAQYDALSGEMRNSEFGRDLERQINDVTDQLKESEEATQRYYRNVGNYANSIKKAFDEMGDELTELKKKYDEVVVAQGKDSKAAEDLKASMEAQQHVMDKTGQYMLNLQSAFIPFGDKIAPLIMKGMSGVKEAFHLAAQGAQILGKQFLALATNPIVAVLGILAAAITLVVNGIKGSEENMNQWNRIMAPVTRALTGLRNVVEILCGWILNVVEAGGRLLFVLGNIVEWATSGIPLIGNAVHSAMEATRESIELEQRQQKLTEDRRKAMVDEAKAQQEIAKLRNEAADASNNDTEARLAANKKAMELELQIANERKRMAKEALALAEAEAAQAGNSTKDNDELARLRADVYNAETEYYKKTKELQSQQNTLEKQIADERKKRADDAKKQAEDRAKAAKEASDKELAAIRQAEDAMLALVKDTAEKRRREIQLQYDREIEDLQKRLEEEKNLSIAAREAINQTIAAKAQEQANALAELEAQISAETIQRKQQEIQLMLEAVKQGTDQEYDLKQKQIQLNLEADLAATDQEIQNLEERERMKALIRAKYAEQEQQLTIERNTAIAEEERQAIENLFTERLMQVEENSLEYARIELERRKYELDNLHQMEGESNAAFVARQLEARKSYNDQKKKLADAEVQIEVAKDKAIASVMGTVGDAITKLAGDNKEAAKLAKVVGIAELWINQAVAISEAIKTAEQGDPYTVAARVAAAVASVVVGMAEAFSAIGKAKFAKGGKVDADKINHATGGKIVGAGTGTSDSIPAMLSNGEFVMTAAATRLFEPTLEAMNKIGSGVNLPTISQSVTIGGMNDETFSDSLAASVAEIRPVVSVVDITEGISRVEAIDTLDTL